MLKYVIIQLCESTPSFCHYKTPAGGDKSLMPILTLKKAIIWALKNNLSIQYLLPSDPLPEEYLSIMSSYEHIDIVPFEQSAENTIDIVSDLDNVNNSENKTIIARTTICDIYNNLEKFKALISKVTRVNIIIEDVENLTSEKEKLYENALIQLADHIALEYAAGRNPSVNILTDRLSLDSMNNCGAGLDFVSIAPDGNFYLCPAFYYDRDPVGSIDTGLDIKNPQLLRIEHAPICRTCDAYQCKRCLWLNKHMTLEINTPSHEQCVLSHIERNVSSYLSVKLHEAGFLDNEKIIEKEECLDPFYKLPRVQLK